MRCTEEAPITVKFTDSELLNYNSPEMIIFWRLMLAKIPVTYDIVAIASYEFRVLRGTPLSI